MVPVEDIISNDYDLSINKYKEGEYVAVEYPPTEQILDAIDALEKEIALNMAELRKLLHE